MAMLIHLPSASDWRRYSDGRIYAPPSLEQEGFIHLARANEAVMVANLLFRKTDDVLAVVIDSRRLGDLRLEMERLGGFAWPHLHEPLPLGAVLAELPYPMLSTGRYGPLRSRLRDFEAGPPLAFHRPINGRDCLEVLDRLQAAGVQAVVDGGWAVDAALGEATRAHGDLDLCLSENSLDAALSALADMGFEVMEDQQPTRVELRSSGGTGHQVDLHPLRFDDSGSGVQQLPDGATFTYPAEGLCGLGRIVGREVRCLTPALQLECHLGYEPDEEDYADVAALCDRFGLLPSEPYAAVIRD